jgi:ribosomal protein L11 methyltransferase
VQAVSETAFAAGCVGAQEDVPEGVVRFIRQPWDTGPAPPPPAQTRLRLWFSEADAPRGLTAVRGQAAGIPGAGEVRVEWDDAQDWAEAWRAGFERIVISDQLAVSPPWSARDGDLVIEPGMAFGTGEHPTTLACLGGIDRNARPGGSLLDVGCGTGVLALAASRRDMTVVGVDIDPEAIRAADENAARNGLTAAFSTRPLQAVDGPFDLVVANIFAEVLVTMATDLHRVCRGRLMLAGILADRAQLVRDALSGFTVVREDREGDWVYLELVPMSGH